MNVLVRFCVALFFLFGALACRWEETPAQHPSLGKSSAAIIGGMQDLRYPSIGALTQSKRAFCTATAIASRLVITAAHCLTSAQSAQSRGIAVEFRVDRPNANTFTSTYYAIDKIIIHPQYAQGNNDIGVISLKTALQGVTPMALNTQSLDNTWVGRQILFLGYGVIQTRPQRISATSKQGVELTLRRIRSDRFDVQDRAKSICSGDSGGPAMYVINNRITLIGVNSYVSGTSSGGVPYCDGSGTAFRVDAYTTWLQPYITQYGGKCQSDADCDPCDTCDTQSGVCQAKTSNKAATFCAPCSSASDCNSDGKSVCARQQTGLRCLQPCDANLCCPAGSTCQEVAGQRQCAPDRNLCPDPVCAADADCGAGEACDPSTKTCQPKPVPPAPTLCKKCSSDADCGGGTCTDYPDAKYCTQPCVGDIFCPKGYSCKSIGASFQCISDTDNCACTQDSDCHTGNACLNKLCQRQGGGKYGDICGDGRSCAAGYNCIQEQSGSICIQSCQTEFPTGEPGSYCQDGQQCVSGHRCFPVRNAGNICLKECSSDASCTNGGACTAVSTVRLCVCSKDEDCRAGFTCNKEALQTSSSLGGRGQCAKKNTNPTQCEKGFTCTFSEGNTYCLPEPSQQPGDECNSSGKRCADGNFCAQTDRGNFICIRGCSKDEDCNPLGGKCTNNGNVSFCNCNNGIACNPGAICEEISSNNSICRENSAEPPPPPLECQQDTDCAANQVCQKNKCVQKQEEGCSNNEECPNGQICKDRQCIPTPTGCSADSECPTRNACLNQKCTPVDCKRDEDCQPNYRCDTNRYKCISTLPPEPSTTEPDSPTKEQASSESTIDAGTKDTGVKTPAGGCGCQAQSGTSIPQSGLLWLLVLLLPLFWRRPQSPSPTQSM